MVKRIDVGAELDTAHVRGFHCLIAVLVLVAGMRGTSVLFVAGVLAAVTVSTIKKTPRTATAPAAEINVAS